MDPFAAALGTHRGPARVNLATDGSTADQRSPRHPHGVWVELTRDGSPRSVLFFVGESPEGAVDTDAAVAAAEEENPGWTYDDWRAA